MNEQLPDPPIDPEVDLRKLEYMPLLGGKLFESDFYLDADDAEFRTGLRLWWAAWNQVPAGSLPAEDHRIRGLAGLTENPQKWRKVRDKALRGFEKHSDGRLYHPVVVEQALIAWAKRAEVMEVHENRQSRKDRMNADRKAMFAALREKGIRLAWDIGMRELRRLHAEHCGGETGTPPGTKPGTPPGTEPETGTPPGTPRTVPGTAKTVRYGTEQIQGTPASVPAPPAGAREEGEGPEDPDPPPEDPPPEDPPQQQVPTPAGRIGWAMRRAGIPPAQCNPSDPSALALLERGATLEQFEDTAREAMSKGIRRPWPWVLATLAGRLDEAAVVAAGPSVQPDPLAWRKTFDGVQRRAAELGLSPRPGEMLPDFERRVLTAHQRAAGRQGAAA